MNINGPCGKTEGNGVLRRYGRRQNNEIKNDLKKEGYRRANCRPGIKMVVRSKRLMNQRVHK